MLDNLRRTQPTHRLLHAFRDAPQLLCTQVVGGLADKRARVGQAVQGLLVRGQGHSDLLLAPGDLPTFTKLHPGRIRQRQALTLRCPFSEACPPSPLSCLIICCQDSFIASNLMDMPHMPLPRRKASWHVERCRGCLCITCHAQARLLRAACIQSCTIAWVFQRVPCVSTGAPSVGGAV